MTIQATPPSYIHHVLDNNWALLETASNLSAHAKERVFQICAVSASATSPQWVRLIAQWGMDLNTSPLQGESGKGQTWLWYALARNKIEQAMALVEAGACVMDVDSNGLSGLGHFVENSTFNIERIIPVMMFLKEHGMAWDTWPDAPNMDGRIIQSTGRSIAFLLAEYEARLLSSNTQFIEHDELINRL